MQTASLVVNLVTAVSALAAVAYHIHHSGFRATMKYFTVLSNTLCAAACLAVAFCRMAGNAPQAALVFKYMGTAAVTVTMITVLLFLMPQYGPPKLFGGADLWLHLLCPLLALLSYFAWDHPAMPFACVLLGLLPVVLYGVLYLWKTILAPAGKRWEDFYGYNRNGRWPVSFAAMMAGGFLISALLWAL